MIMVILIKQSAPLQMPYFSSLADSTPLLIGLKNVLDDLASAILSLFT